MGFWTILRGLVIENNIPITPLLIIKSIYMNFGAVVQFIGKTFFPFNLNVLPIIQDTSFIYGIVTIILLIFSIFLTKNKRWNFILLGLMWFFAFLLPAFIRPSPDIIADFLEHRLYVPIIGIFIILLETDFIKKIDFKKRSTLVIVSILILMFSFITLVHSRNFVNKLAFWKNATQNSPHHPLAHRNLGAMLYLDGDIKNAEKEYKIALELNPNEQMVHNNLGLAYVQQNKFQNCQIHYLSRM